MGIRERIMGKVRERSDRMLRAAPPMLCNDRNMRWYPFFPSWQEVCSHVTREGTRFARRGGKISAVVMSQTTWMRLCDNRERRGIRPGLGRAGQLHYDKRKLMGHPVRLDGDVPFGSVYCQGT